MKARQRITDEPRGADDARPAGWSRAGFWTVFGGIVAALSLVASFLVTPVDNFFTNLMSSQGPALTVEDIRDTTSSIGGYSTWEWYFPEKLSAHQVNSIKREYDKGGLTNDHSSVNKLARGYGGKPIGFIYIEGPGGGSGNRYHFNLVGNRNAKVRINDMRVRVLERKNPQGGTLMTQIGAGGGGTDVLAVDLDSPDKRVMAVDASASPNTVTPFFDTASRYAELGESLPFDLGSYSRMCWCTWELVIDVSYEVGRRRSPFAGTAQRPARPSKPWSWTRAGWRNATRRTSCPTGSDANTTPDDQHPKAVTPSPIPVPPARESRHHRKKPPGSRQRRSAHRVSATGRRSAVGGTVWTSPEW